jgi:hypothetical protein
MVKGQDWSWLRFAEGFEAFDDFERAFAFFGAAVFETGVSVVVPLFGKFPGETFVGQVSCGGGVRRETVGGPDRDTLS